MLNTIDYQIIIFLINFTTKFEEEPPWETVQLENSGENRDSSS